MSHLRKPHRPKLKTPGVKRRRNKRLLPDEEEMGIGTEIDPMEIDIGQPAKQETRSVER